MMTEKMTRFTIAFALSCSMLFGIPLFAAAETSDDVLVPTVTYTITFTVQARHKAIYLPVLASRAESTGQNLGFEIISRKDSEIIESGIANGILLSNLPLTSDLQYKVPAGDRETFTLVIIHTRDDNYADDLSYSRQVRVKIPDKKDSLVKLKHADAELSFTRPPTN